MNRLCVSDGFGFEPETTLSNVQEGEFSNAELIPDHGRCCDWTK
jgi:hypothetical protein